MVGLVLSQAITITGLFNVLVRKVTDCEMDLTSVERILHYTSNIEQEAALEIQYIPSISSNSNSFSTQQRIPKNWPTNGRISISNLTLRYRSDLNAVLSNISLRFQPSEKIGICGRTGACLFFAFFCLFFAFWILRIKT